MEVGDEDYVRVVMGSSNEFRSPREVRAEKDETGRHTDRILEGDNFLGEASVICRARQPGWCGKWCEIKWCDDRISLVQADQPAPWLT